MSSAKFSRHGSCTGGRTHGRRSQGGNRDYRDCAGLSLVRHSTFLMDASIDAQLEIPQHLPTQENSVEIWFSKSILATLCIVPSFIAVPFMKFRFGVDPLVFLAWYFGATSISIVVYLLICGRSEEILPPASALAIIITIGAIFGALANGSLFQAIGLAPNPGLPPVMYATSA